MRFEPTDPLAVMCATALTDIRARFIAARAVVAKWEPRPCPPKEADAYRR